MLYGVAAYRETGMPGKHAGAIQDVVERSGHAIIFRAVGKQSTQLLKEGYAAKGFRIDTKSCDWGPMRGFVCVDPRLSKVGGDAKKVSDNQRYTAEAIGGRIRHDAVGGLDTAMLGDDAVMPDWMAGYKPVVISALRYRELEESGMKGVTNSAGIIKGVSTDKTQRVRIPWALIPVARCEQVPSFRAACGQGPPGGYGVFIDYDNRDVRFKQQLPEGIRAVRVLGYEAVLGLTNPGTDAYGYRACVTGDYDLFAVWAPVPKQDPFRTRHNFDDRIVSRHQRENPTSKQAHHHQHFKLGNITGRINMMKIMLNTALIAMGGFPGGNLVHHSDEVGNPSPGLKKTLLESFPLLAFVPQACERKVGLCVTNTLDFSQLVNLCQKGGIAPDLRPEWGNFASV